MCGLFLTGPESRCVFEEARSLEVLTSASTALLCFEGVFGSNTDFKESYINVVMQRGGGGWPFCDTST